MFRCLAKLVVLAFVVLAAALFLLCQYFVSRAGDGRLYTSANEVPPRDFGLVLGTSERLGDGRENPYFQKRIEAAAELYRLGKVKYFLLSGDNRTNNYNEPMMMSKALVAKGVPKNVLFLDEAGLRTLDSIVRAKEVFCLERFTIISQRAHDERALLIARHYDIDAVAYCADDIPFRYAVQSHIHEWLARVKVILDLYILHTAPRHLGEKIPLPPK